jgi:threonine/homoserine/homoserine lactone efflux protein
LLLLALTWFGLNLIRRLVPHFDLVAAIAGAAYLGWIGAVLAVKSGRSAEAPTGLPTGAGGVALFQLANPKAWVLVMTAVAAVTAQGDVLVLAGLMSAISLLCLVVWAGLGAALAKSLKRPGNRILFDRAMGALLMLSALGVLFDAIH